MGVKFGMEEGTAKFHPHRCNVSPLRGEKPQNWPLSKLNTGRFALRAMLPVIICTAAMMLQKANTIASGVGPWQPVLHSRVDVESTNWLNVFNFTMIKAGFDVDTSKPALIMVLN